MWSAYELIDDDVVTESSLNRVVGALPQDVSSRTPKVESGRTTHHVNSTRELAVSFLEACVTCSSEDAVAASIRKADVVFGCLDRESPRLFLTDLCSRLHDHLLRPRD